MPAPEPTSPAEPLPVRLVNTLWSQRGALRDDLEAPQRAVEWLHDNGFPVTGVDPQGVDALVRLRTALRTVAAHLTGDTREPAPGSTPGPATDDRVRGDVEAAVALIDQLSRSAPARHLVLAEGRLTWSAPPAATTVDDALSTLAAAAATFFTGLDAERLRACHGPRCIVYFTQDHVRRQWCSPGCGNRARAARHYRRHQGDTAVP
ncbi:ABATE domain-containing protein [Kineococcus sp. SYSU DK002]|uniref:ABATE domain-containing protein n=1 Tax=Kineococcus sp. SYSU DK002 TaxID=3383123 RepID=UPI003D7DD18E